MTVAYAQPALVRLAACPASRRGQLIQLAPRSGPGRRAAGPTGSGASFVLTLSPRPSAGPIGQLKAQQLTKRPVSVARPGAKSVSARAPCYGSICATQAGPSCLNMSPAGHVDCARSEHINRGATIKLAAAAAAVAHRPAHSVTRGAPVLLPPRARPKDTVCRAACARDREILSPPSYIIGPALSLLAGDLPTSQLVTRLASRFAQAHQ